MQLKNLIPLLALSGVAAFAPGASRWGDTPDASTVLKEAFTKAKKENKIAMIVFHASW